MSTLERCSLGRPQETLVHLMANSAHLIADRVLSAHKPPAQIGIDDESLRTPGVPMQVPPSDARTGVRLTEFGMADGDRDVKQWGSEVPPRS
jgi:hypothetical protein